MEDRSQYDKMMMAKHNPIKENYGYQSKMYHTDPWPGARTHFDKDLQQKWCPTCEMKPYRPAGDTRGGKIAEGYAPLHGFRTQFDDQLQHKWCPDCKHPHKEGYSTMHDWDNKWTYSHAPYRT